MSDTRRWIPLKPETFEILLAAADGPVHGYGILKALDARGVHVAASLLYRKIRRLMEDGLLAEVAVAREGEPDDARRRYYGLTPLGRGVLEAEGARLLELAAVWRLRQLREGVDHA